MPVDFHYFQVSTVRNGKVAASYMAETKSAALATRKRGLLRSP